MEWDYISDGHIRKLEAVADAARVLLEAESTRDAIHLLPGLATALAALDGESESELAGRRAVAAYASLELDKEE